MQIEIKPGNKFVDLEQAQAAVALVVVPFLAQIIKDRLENGTYKVIDGRIVKCDNGENDIFTTEVLSNEFQLSPVA